MRISRLLLSAALLSTVFSSGIYGGPAGTGAGLFPFLFVGSMLPDVSVRVPPGEVPFGALFSIEPTYGFRRRHKLFHRFTAQYHIKAENTFRVAYQPFIRPWYSFAFGCGIGYFNQHATEYSGLTILPAIEYIFEGDSEMTLDFGATMDLRQPYQEVNLTVGFHYRGFWENRYN